MKKLVKRSQKIIKLLFKDVKKLAKCTIGNEFYVSHKEKVDKSGVLHFCVKLDFPVGKIKAKK